MSDPLILGRHDADIQNIKSDLSEVREVVLELRDHMVSQKALVQEDKESKTHTLAVTSGLSALVSATIALIPHIFSSKSVP